MDPRPLSDDFRARLRAVKLLCLDVDGVLTDGNLYWTEGNGWSQRFSVRDGYGIKLLQELDVTICILSGGDVRSARARADSLGIKRAYFGITDKVAVFKDVAGALALQPSQAAFIGDELVDIPLLKIVGISATVPEAVDEVLATAEYVTRRPGGAGAVRELCDLIRANR